MLIANPIYDVVFKRLMENEKVAKFFIGTLLEQTIESIEVKPQEFTYTEELIGIAVFRLDFIATIRTSTGEQYKKEDKIGNENIVLPITTIYILGFKLPEISSPCLKVARNYIDLITKTPLLEKSDFVEKLTHDSFVVQVSRISNNRYQTSLDKLLSVFEQRNFVDDKEIVKDYLYTPDTDDLRNITDILHYVGTNPQEKKKIEIEQEAWRSVNAMFEEKEKKYQRQLEEKERELSEKDKNLSEKERELSEKEQALSEKDKLIAELMRKLNEKQ
jgi:hypothetical protein